MKVLILVETPEDDELEYRRVVTALRVYCSLVERNNDPAFSQNELMNLLSPELGMDGGPNKMVLESSSGRTIVTESRIDNHHLQLAALAFTNRLLSWAWGK